MNLAKIAGLALLSQQQGCASIALQHLLPAAANIQQRFYQAAVDHSADAAEINSGPTHSSSTQQRNSTPRPPQQQWTPQRSLPPSTHYGVKVTIKAHDLKFAKLASTVIRDLMLVNFAPKSQDAVPPGWSNSASGVPYVKLAVPIGDAATPTKRTHWTVIRGPHVHKTSREQFARITHQRVITYATNNVSELNWFLDSLKLYKFIGVELVVRVTSSSYLLPTTAEQQAAADQPLLLSHKQKFSHLFGAAAPAHPQQQQQQQQQDAGGSSSSSYAALQQSLQGLRQNLHDSLLQQRMILSAAAPAYERWREGDDGKAAAAVAAAAVAAAAASSPQASTDLDDIVSQQLVGSNMAAAAEGAEGGEQQQQHSGAALVAAVDKALLQLKLDVLDRHKYFPYMMAFYTPGQQQLSPAEWMHAMLKYGKMRQAEVESSQAAAALQAYQQYGQVNQTLLLMLLQQWYKAADTASRQELVMPPAGQVDEMLP